MQIRDAALGLEYLHDKGVIHSDMKAVRYLFPPSLTWVLSHIKDNILITCARRAVICDFGCAQMVADISRSLGKVTTTTKGTSAFWSPELWEGQGTVRQSKESDVWAFGMTIYVYRAHSLLEAIHLLKVT